MTELGGRKWVEFRVGDTRYEVLLDPKSAVWEYNANGERCLMIMPEDPLKLSEAFGQFIARMEQAQHDWGEAHHKERHFRAEETNPSDQR